MGTIGWNRCCGKCEGRGSGERARRERGKEYGGGVRLTLFLLLSMVHGRRVRHRCCVPLEHTIGLCTLYCAHTFYFPAFSVPTTFPVSHLNTSRRPLHFVLPTSVGSSNRTKTLGPHLLRTLCVLRAALDSVPKRQWYVKSVFIVHVGGTRCVTFSTANIMNIHVRITLTVECIRTRIFLVLFYV